MSHARRRALRLGLASLSLAAAGACAAVVGVDGLEVGECKGGVCAPDSGENDVDVDPGDGAVVPDSESFDGGPPCVSTAGPAAVRVGPPENRFCIDGTEVTFAQYGVFLDAGVDAASQPPECAWNTSFVPASTGNDTHPVTDVDWCDALAYCKWAGKYLCGRAVDGKKTGPVSEGEVGDYNTHQWLIACSQQTNLYPYGNDADVGACNVGENDAGRTLPVGSKPDCESYPGVFDMVGNVWEWYDGPCRTDAGAAADAGPDASPALQECWLKGGAYVNRGANINCRVDGLGSRRDTKTSFIGFRCCSD